MANTKQLIKYFFLIIILAAFFCLSLFAGAEKISIDELLHDRESFSSIIFFDLRLPRSILAVFTGALLASSAAIFQLFFRNYLAEPGLLGISSGAAVGAVTSQITGISVIAGGLLSTMNLFAFIAALIAGLILVAISSVQKRTNLSVMLLLCGTALGTLYSAISSILMLIKNREIFGIYSWLMGSFNGKSWAEVKFLLIPAVLSFVLMFLISSSLDLLNGGEQSAQTLGVNVNRLRISVILTGSIAVSVCVCAGGTIGFIGLIAPNLMRKFFGPKAKTLIASSALCGGALLVLSDTLARIVIAPAEIPCGIITAIIGVPFFLSLIFKQERI